ncbi:MAG: c-type cytochrome [Thermostichus sp. HHBFW_bins_43]
MFKRWIFKTLGVALLIGLLGLGFVHPAAAEPDLSLGAKVFQAKCIGCHLGGRNSLVAAKNLTLAALQEYHVDTPELIQNQVTKGKGAMPAFGKQLKPEEIESVAAYVLQQAERNWGKA